VHEARRLYGADRPLVVVSIGTGSALPRPSDNSYRGYPSWIANIFNATGNVRRTLLPFAWLSLSSGVG
jgi:hypothetical protein